MTTLPSGTQLCSSGRMASGEGVASGNWIHWMVLRSALLLSASAPLGKQRRPERKGVRWGCRSLDHGLPTECMTETGAIRTSAFYLGRGAHS